MRQHAELAFAARHHHVLDLAGKHQPLRRDEIEMEIGHGVYARIPMPSFRGAGLGPRTRNP